MYFINLCVSLKIVDYSLIHRLEDASSGRREEMKRDSSLGCAEQLITNIRILRFGAKNFLSRALIHLINKAYHP